MRVLFTGHSGFIGRELIPLLSESEDIHIFNGNLLEEDRLRKFIFDRKIEAVIHCAAKVPLPNHHLSMKNMYENLEISKIIMNLNLPSLFFCSGKIFGSKMPVQNVKEDEWIHSKNRDLYGESKYVIRKMGQGYPNISFIRLFNIFGSLESERRFIKKNMKLYLYKQPMQISNDVYFDTFYVQDLIPIIKYWLKCEKFPKDLNVVYREKRKLLQYCEIINELSDHKVLIEENRNIESSFDYFGDGTLLESLNLKITGLQNGIKLVFDQLNIESFSDKAT